MEKRKKVIAIRVTDSEYLALQQRKTKNRLAVWLRDLALGEKPKTQPKPVDPKLLYELNRIGVNLNQIARYCNEHKKDELDLISIALSLRDIDSKLKEILTNAS